MFDRITNKELLVKLVDELDNITRSDFGSLLQELQTQNIGECLNQRLHHEISCQPQAAPWSPAMDILYKTSLTCFFDHISRTLMEDGIRLGNVTEYLKATIPQLEGTEIVTDHTETETKTAISFILPYFELHVLSHTVVEKILAGESQETILDILKSNQWNQLQPVTGVSKLKQASAMFVLGYSQRSLDILSQLTDFYRVSTCSCGYHTTFIPEQTALLKAVRNYSATSNIKESFTDCLAHCVAFFPSEQQITPAAINYEMIRCFGMPPGISLYKLGYNRRTWGAVDGKFLELFLLHLNHRTLGQNSLAMKDLRKMILLLNKETPSHRETCLNLLGWAHKERGRVDLAVQCFQKSLKLEPMFNAAFWHLCFLICGY